MIKLIQNSALVIFSFLFGLLAVEGILRVADPFETRISANKIKLPVGVRYQIRQENPEKGTDEVIVHNKNQLGFRGEEWPENPASREKWVFVGGSTTESFYFNDEDTWVALLTKHQEKRRSNLWVNNAGLDGHTSFGHIVLTRDYLVDIKPEKIFYLVGINDVGYDAPKHYDKKLNSSGLRGWILQNTEIGKLAYLIWRTYKTSHIGVRHDLNKDWSDALNHSAPSMPSSQEIEIIRLKHRDGFIPGYRKRIEKLVNLALNNGIEPVLITQPALFGPGIDPSTGYSLAAGIHPGGLDGRTRWLVLEEYNNVLRSVAQESNVTLIDLARKLPKDTKLYYDWIHYNKAGQMAVANIINTLLD